MLRRNTSALVITAAAATLLASGAGAALGSTHARQARGALITTPTLRVTITQHGQTSSMTVAGPHTISAGRVDLKLKAVGGEQAVEVLRMKPGHRYQEAESLFNTFAAGEQSAAGPTPAQLRDLRKLVRIVTFYGGLDTGSFTTARGSVALGHVGRYLLVNDENGPQPHPFKLTVTAKAGSRATPKVGAVVKAITAKRFRGATTLPASGTVEFENAATNSPHFLVLQHVKKGTTRRQVIASFRSASNGPPSFALPENADTDVVGMGHSMTMTYHLPAGEYVEMCFFPDLQTGMPHAAMGMVRIVHLK